MSASLMAHTLLCNAAGTNTRTHEHGLFCHVRFVKHFHQGVYESDQLQSEGKYKKTSNMSIKHVFQMQKSKSFCFGTDIIVFPC